MISAFGTLTDVCVTSVVAVTAVISVAVSAVDADAAVFAYLGSAAKRAFIALLADVFFITLYAVLAAVRQVVVHLVIVKQSTYDYLFTVRAQYVEFVFLHFFYAGVTSYAFRRLVQFGAVFADHAVFTVRKISVFRVYTVFTALRTMEAKLRRAQITRKALVAVTCGAIFADVAVEAHFNAVIFPLAANIAFPAICVYVQYRGLKNRR